MSALIHTANRDYKSLIEDLIALEVLPADTDRSQVWCEWEEKLALPSAFQGLVAAFDHRHRNNGPYREWMLDLRLAGELRKKCGCEDDSLDSMSIFLRDVDSSSQRLEDAQVYGCTLNVRSAFLTAYRTDCMLLRGNLMPPSRCYHPKPYAFYPSINLFI